MALQRVAGCVGLFCLLALSAANSRAEEGVPNPSGRPERFTQGKGTGYAVWEEDGVWKVRTTSGEKAGRVVFTGTVRVEGDKFIGAFQGLEKGKERRDADGIFVHKDKKGFDFKFVTVGKTDGLDFKLGPKATSVTFKLLIAGDDDPKRILIGKRGQHPDKATFTFPAPLPPK